jgi:hypothetical protein
MMRALCAAVVAACATACLQDTPEVPCNGDETCPTGSWCGYTNTCFSLADSSPPQLVLDGVGFGEAGPFKDSIVIRSAGSSFTMRVTNIGGAEAYPNITLASPPCFDLDKEVSSSLTRILRENESGVMVVHAFRPKLPCPEAEVTVQFALPQGNSTDRFVRTSSGSFRLALGP